LQSQVLRALQGFKERNIKTLFWLAVLVAAGLYSCGSWSFRASSLNAFLDGWEAASRRGDAGPICDSLAFDMTFSTHDSVGDRALDRKGDRAEFCDSLNKVLPRLAQSVKSTNTTRDNLTVTRDATHWWTADVSYIEHEEMTLDTGMHLKQVSENHLMLVKTLRGLRVKRLVSDSQLEK
jgi:hypothetical protein